MQPDYEDDELIGLLMKKAEPGIKRLFQEESRGRHYRRTKTEDNRTFMMQPECQPNLSGTAHDIVEDFDMIFSRRVGISSPHARRF